MIWHEHVSWTNEFITRAGMQQENLPRLMKRRCQPTRGAIFGRQGPMNECATAVVLRHEARKVAFADCVHSLTLVPTKRGVNP
jgi:hypothetical protein